MADVSTGAAPDMSDGGLEAEDPALAAASELAQPSPEPESGFAGFAVLLVAFVFAVLFLQRSRKKRSTEPSGAPEPAKRTPVKGAAKRLSALREAQLETADRGRTVGRGERATHPSAPCTR